MRYAIVKNGTVIGETTGLPDTFENVSGFRHLPALERKAFGFYEVNDVAPILGEFDTIEARSVLYNPARDEVTVSYITKTAPPEVIRAARWEQVKAKRDVVLDGGVQVGGQWFHTDTRSLIQWLAMFVLGNNLQAGISWKTKGGGRVPVDKKLVADVFGAVMAKDRAAFERGEALKLALDSAPDPRTVDIDSGWPESYA